MIDEDGRAPVLTPDLASYYDASKDVFSAEVPVGWQELSRSDRVDMSPKQDAQHGFAAEAYTNSAGQILFAFRPTVLSTSMFGRGTLSDDLMLARGLTPPAFDDAVTFVSNVIRSAELLNKTASSGAKPAPFDLATVFVTGYSLGGAEAEYVVQQAVENPASPVYRQSMVGVTFAAPGIPVLAGSETDRPSIRLLNLVLPGDPVANYAHDVQPDFAPANVRHFGRVVMANEPPGLFASIEGLFSKPLVAGIESLSSSGSFVGGIAAAIDLIAGVVRHHPLRHYGSAFLPRPGDDNVPLAGIV